MHSETERQLVERVPAERLQTSTLPSNIQPKTLLRAKEHNVLGLTWRRNNSVCCNDYPTGSINRVFGVRFQKMVAFYLLQSRGTGSGPNQFFIQPLQRTFSPGTGWPGREANTLLPKLPIRAVEIPLPHTSSRPAIELTF